jgi:type II secretory pathway component GspD/PulD (secretin)
MNIHLTATLAALTIAAPLALAQQPRQATPPQPAPAARTAEPFVLEAGQIELPTLIERVAAYLDYNLLYNQAEFAAPGNTNIRLTRRTEVDRAGCWEMFNALLYHKGFAILVLDEARGLYEIVFANGSRRSEISTGALFVPQQEVEAYAKLKAIPILTPVALQNVNATIAVNSLRPFFSNTSGPSSGITLGSTGTSSDILVQGFGPQVAAACRLLQLVDTGIDGGQLQVRVVALAHAAPADIVACLEDTLGARSLQAAMQHAMPTGVPLRSVPHPALNAVVLSGSESQLGAALDLVSRLDQPAKTPNAPSADVVRRLQQLEQRVQQLEAAARGATPKDGQKEGVGR